MSAHRVYAEATVKTLGVLLRQHVKAAQNYLNQMSHVSVRKDQYAHEDRAAFIATALREIHAVAEELETRTDAVHVAPMLMPSAVPLAWPVALWVGVAALCVLAARAVWG